MSLSDFIKKPKEENPLDKRREDGTHDCDEKCLKEIRKI